MATKIHKPITPGTRGATMRDFSSITKTKPTKTLLKPLKKTGGRNNQGRITVRHIGGGHKRRFRIINFIHATDILGTVMAIEYDPNRSAHIALIEYADGQKDYMVATKDMKVGSMVESSENAPIRAGNTLQLKNIPTGIAIHNIELTKGKGATLVRSAGLSATILAHENGMAVVKLPSGELRRINEQCIATIGEVSNPAHENTVFGKAGRKRWLGIRPTVRGKAMNPNSHPHGGGEGVTPIGMKYAKTPWGMPALGRRTRDKNKASSNMIMRRRSS